MGGEGHSQARSHVELHYKFQGEDGGNSSSRSEPVNGQV